MSPAPASGHPQRDSPGLQLHLCRQQVTCASHRPARDTGGPETPGTCRVLEEAHRPQRLGLPDHSSSGPWFPRGRKEDVVLPEAKERGGLGGHRGAPPWRLPAPLLTYVREGRGACERGGGAPSRVR